MGLWPHCSGLGPRLREVSSPYVSSPPLCFSYEDTVIGFQLHTDNPGRPHLETLGHLQSRHFQARPRARVWAAASWEALGALGAGAAPCQGLSSGSRREAAGSPALRAPLFPAGALKACDLDWPVGCPGPSPWKLPFLICPPCSLGCLVGAQPSPHGCRSDSVGLRGWNQDSASLRACVSFPRDLVEVKELVRLEILFRSHVSPGMTLHTAQSLSRRCPRRPTRGPCTDARAEAGRPQGSGPRRAGSGPAAWLLGSSCPLLCRSDVLPRRQTRPGEGCVRNPRNNF